MLNRQQILDELGLVTWRLRGPSQGARARSDRGLDTEPAIDPAQSMPGDDHPDLSSQEQAVAQCRRCALAATRTHTVFGTGNPHASWLFIGEAPGAEEDRQGLPFVGRAGQLLNAMLAALGMRREDVYIANVLKCRPPDNRDPLGDEVVQCSPYLLQQVQAIRPDMIVSLGRFAAQALLKTHTPIGKLRGRVHYYGDSRIPLVPTYHPAYLLRSPLEKRKAWQDLLLARETYNARSAS